MEEDTQPDTLTRPPRRRGWWARVRYHAGTAGLVAVIVAILAGIAVAGSLVPAVRHGVGKVITHHDSPGMKSQLVSPSLRDGSPSLSPSSYKGTVTRPRPSRTASATPTRRRERAVPSPAPRPATTRATPTVTPTVQPATSSSAPSTTAPAPTPTPTTTTTTPAPASVSPTVTVVPTATS
jgi:cytoskeletal protein RodZ